jgi:hypothetical protein
MSYFLLLLLLKLLLLLLLGTYLVGNDQLGTIRREGNIVGVIANIDGTQTDEAVVVGGREQSNNSLSQDVVRLLIAKWLVNIEIYLKNKNNNHHAMSN